MEQGKIPQKSKDDSTNPIENPAKNVLLEKTKKNEAYTGSKAEDTKKNKYPKLKLWWKHNSIQAIMAIATIGTLIAYIVVSIHQNNLTREALRRSDSANVLTKKSLDLTRKADSIAEQALIHSIKADSENGVLNRKDTLARFNNVKRELRAYLSVESLKIDSIGDNFIIYGVNLINTGKTPAKEIRGSAGITRGDDLSDKEVQKIGYDVAEYNSITRGGGVSFSINWEQKTSHVTQAEFLSEKWKEKGKLIIIGNVFYRDIFGDLHRSSFCYKLFPISAMRFRCDTYPKYNDGD